MRKTGHIYILQTPYEGILKVGLTKRDVSTRANELSSQTGVIGKFTLLTSYEVPVAIVETIEKQSHKYLKSKNLHHSKEYFNATQKQCESAVEQALLDTNAHKLLQDIKDKTKTEKDLAHHEASEKQSALLAAFSNENKLLIASILENFNDFKFCIDEGRQISFTQSLFSKKDEFQKLTRRKNELKVALGNQRKEFKLAEHNFMQAHRLKYRKNFFTNLNGGITNTFYQFDRLLKMGW